MMKHTHRIVPLSSLLLAPLLALGCGQGGGDELSSLQQAATIQVPDDYASIQAAVDAAADGDTIEVAPGNYEEDVVVYGKAVELIGDAAQRPRLFGSLYFSNADFSVLRRFEVVGPGGFSSGVRAYASSISIVAVQVSNHDTGLSFAVAGAGDTRLARVVATGCGRGFVIENGAAAELVNCLALFNSDDGVRVTASASATVVHCDAVGNGAYQSGDAGLSCAGACTLANNIAVNNDVGLSCSGDCDADHNLIWGNWLNYGAGASAGPNDLSTDPRFSNPAEYDFHLQETSPAIDAGGEPTAAADFDGVPRPQAEAVDIGAYEYRLLASELTLAINEVMANPTDEASGEFVELYNYGDAAVDAAGLVIWDGDSTDALAGYQGGSTLIPAGGYALVLDPDYTGGYDIDAGVRLLTVDDTAIGNGLSTSDPISLWEPNGVTPIDRFSFPSNPGDGVSIEKVSIEEGDVLSNWKSSPCSASPGAGNCASQPGNVAREVLIAINEVMANPLDEATGEFVELYNFGDESVDLAGFVLTDGDSTDALVGFDGGGTVLLPGDYALIVDPDYAGQYDLPGSTLLLTAADSATLGNGLSISDPVSLLDASGQSVVDSFSRPFDPGNGTSIEKVDATVGDVPANWVTSTCAAGSSPGAVNCAAGGTPVAGDTIAITEVMANALDEDSGEYVELYNYGQESVDVLGWHIDDGDAVDTIEGFAGGTTIIPAGGWALVLDREYAEDYNLPGGAVLLTTDDTTIGSGLATTDVLTLRSAAGSAVVDAMSFPFNPGNGISVEKADLVVGDVPQNWVASPCNHSPGAINCAMGGGSDAELSATFIVLSEVMANPLDEASGEYLELFNAGANAVDVGGWVISDGDSTDTILGQGAGTAIQPGQYAVVQDPDYAGDYVIPAEALLLTVGSGALGNSLSTNDPITLYEADGTTVVDTFSFPTNPGNGVAMEKRTLTGGDEQTNWAASTCRTPNADNDYASPGARNCADWGNGLTGDQVVGEACPYGAVDCLSGLCLVDLYTLETYCSETCPGGSGCQGGFSCTVIEDIWGTGATEVCVRD